MAKLGVAREYEAVILDSKTEQPLLYLPWSSITWQRVRNRVSQASVVIAEDDGGIEACGAIGGLRPWTQMLRIERNGRPVWDGPIMSWYRPSLDSPGVARGVTIQAYDRWVLMQKRLLAFNLTASEQYPMNGVFDLLLPFPDDAFFPPKTNDPYKWSPPQPLVTSAVTTAGAPSTFNSIYTDRAYRVSALENVYDLLQELADQKLITFTQIKETTWANEVEVRDLLGPRGTRPILTDTTTNNLPGVNVDGLSQANVLYTGGQSTGRSGFSVYVSQSPYGRTIITSQLEGSVVSQRSTEVDPRYDQQGFTTSLDVEAALESLDRATPEATIEQAQLGPEFGSPLLDEGLDLLVPGVVFDIQYDGSCAFNIPVTSSYPVFRFWFTDPSTAISYNAYLPTPVKSETITAGRLEQLDVTVTAGEEGINEQMLASLTATADWDGTLPATWSDISPPARPEQFFGDAGL